MTRTLIDARDAPTILAIESSCDETCAAVVRGRTVLSSVVSSQTALHAAYGGIVPEIASRRHVELVDAVIEQAQHDAESAVIDTIAVTRGPGLMGALLVGLANAKARAWALGLPLRTVDHLHGHVSSALLSDPELEPPFVCLLASGGHTMIVEVDAEMGLTCVGSTRDDAAGEAFDKGARMLGLVGQGGPAIENAARDGDASRVTTISPAMVHADTLDTSFAGIKTALANALRSAQGDARRPSVADFAAAYQSAIIATLAACIRKSIDRLRPATFALVGGVGANAALQAEMTQICEQYGVHSVTVPLRWCGDNAAMIGASAAFHQPLDAAQARIIDAYPTSPLFSQRHYVPTKATDERTSKP